MPGRLIRIARPLPQSLVGRIYALYSATLLLFVGLGLGLFFHYQLQQQLEDVQQSATMLVEVVAQTITDSAVIGDYDTIQRTLDKSTLRSHFSSALYIDIYGGIIRSDSEHPVDTPAPEWLRALLAGQLYDVNRVIVAGGRDYGVLRLGFAVDAIAGDQWKLLRSALALAIAGLCGGLLLIWFPLRHWLGALDRARLYEQRAADGQASDTRKLLADLPLEFRPMFEVLDQTASSLRGELEAREKALVALREILAGLGAIPEAGPDGGRDDLAELTAAVARLVAEREASRHELEKARDAAESANLIKSQFLANMSHEIRTPMNGILGMTTLALHSDLEPAQREYLSIVKSSAESLLTVINDILDFSKIEAGKLHIEQIPYELPGTVRDTLHTFRLRAEEKGLALDCRIAPDVPDAVVGDPVRLRQVLLNLLSNAVKFTERGRIELSLGRLSDEPGGPLHFAIRDTGIGVGPEQQALIFEAFAQADASTTRRYGGTGLGLSISRRLVELMGGRIWMNSVAGEGSTFHFTVPCQIAEPVEAAALPAAEIPPAVSSSARSPRVLLVEDNLVNQKVACALLERRNYHVRIAGNGEEAVAALAAGHFDVVLMDVQMPVMGGLEATRVIREQEAASGRPRVPIVAMTANAMQGDREQCFAAGMDDYVSKPIRADDLYAALERRLAG